MYFRRNYEKNSLYAIVLLDSAYFCRTQTAIAL